MRKLIIPIFCVAAVFTACQNESNKRDIAVNYPETEKKPVVDTYFGTDVTDNYRWLEDDRSKETEAWVKTENEVTFNYLDKIPYREELKNRLSELWNYEKVGSPFIEGDYTYYYKNDGLQNQYVVYRKKGGDGKEEVFLDPNTFSEDGTTSLSGLSFSKDGKPLLILFRKGEATGEKSLSLTLNPNKLKKTLWLT
jgi:prolyl oligopeptidase